LLNTAQDPAIHKAIVGLLPQSREHPD